MVWAYIKGKYIYFCMEVDGIGGPVAARYPVQAKFITDENTIKTIQDAIESLCQECMYDMMEDVT